MNILLTGGSGFLGSRIKYFALKKGLNVISPRSRELDLESEISVKKFISENFNTNISAIIHSAVFYGGIGTNLKYPADLIFKNNLMTNSIYKIARDLNVLKFVSVGSACAWPGDAHGDLKENEVFNGRPHDSIEAYGFNKRVHLIFNKAYFKQFGMQSNQLALANLYGENDVFDEERSHVISSFIKKAVDAKLTNSIVSAWGTGKPIRQFLYVDDAAKVLVESLNFNHDLDPINIYGESLSIKDLFNKIAKIVGLDSSQVKWDHSISDGVERKVLDEGKLKKILPEFKFIPFQKGLENTINWYLKNKEIADRKK